MKFPIFKFNRGNVVEYWVRADGSHNLVFDTREKARQYRKLLQQSKSQIKAQIVRREADGMWRVREDVIS